MRELLVSKLLQEIEEISLEEGLLHSESLEIVKEIVEKEGISQELWLSLQELHHQIVQDRRVSDLEHFKIFLSHDVVLKTALGKLPWYRKWPFAFSPRACTHIELVVDNACEMNEKYLLDLSQAAPSWVAMQGLGSAPRSVFLSGSSRSHSRISAEYNALREASESAEFIEQEIDEILEKIEETRRKTHESFARTEALQKQAESILASLS